MKSCSFCEPATSLQSDLHCPLDVRMYCGSKHSQPVGMYVCGIVPFLHDVVEAHATALDRSGFVVERCKEGHTT